MRIRKPNRLELDYSQRMMAWMLFKKNPARICQLGLGAGALTKFTYSYFEEATTTAVELNPDVISICRSMFALPADDDRLKVLEMDAMDFVNDPANFGVFDVIHSDLYDATARGPVLDSPEFYAACKKCLTEDGILTVNLFGEHPSYDRNLRSLRKAFDEVVPLTPTTEGNVIAVAFRKRPIMTRTQIKDRAGVIKNDYGLPAKRWIEDFCEAFGLE